MALSRADKAAIREYALFHRSPSGGRNVRIRKNGVVEVTVNTCDNRPIVIFAGYADTILRKISAQQG